MPYTLPVRHSPRQCATLRDDDPAGETYWKIEHGIRFTGMPSYAGTLGEEQIWHIAYFLKNGTETGTVKMPAAAEKAWMSPHGD